jgi:hypothetical protein
MRKFTVQLVDSNTIIKNHKHRRLKHSWIQMFEKESEDASAINNIWKIITRFANDQSYMAELESENTGQTHNNCRHL